MKYTLWLMAALVSTLSIQAMADDCSDLNTLAVEAGDIGLPTRGAVVDSTSWVNDGSKNAGNDVCRVRGHIKPVTNNGFAIHFQVNLPKKWNEKSLHVGGGGFNGVLIEANKHYTAQPTSELTPLQQGFATYGSDSGHQSKINFDGRFMLNEEALLNFGHQQLKKTHDVAQRIIETFYGRATNYRYFIGGSQGGHEAFDVVQRFPSDYHGVIAGYPAHNEVMLHLSANVYARALLDNDGAGWLNPAKVETFVAEIYSACDSLDGAEDGIISNSAACAERTLPFSGYDESNPVRCANGKDTGNNCLSDAQIRALNIINSPLQLDFSIFPDDEGNTVFPGWTPFVGSTFFDANFPNLGGEGPHQALQAMPGDATLRYAIARDISIEPLKGFDPNKYAGRITDLAGLMSANSSNIDAFQQARGKLIFFHGSVDDFIPVTSSIDYWQRLQKRYPTESLSEFVKFYVIPGMGHVTGPFKARMATFDALQAWVERGQVPATLTAIDENPATKGRTRPVCEFPLWPKYKGGDINQASSFQCSK
mgnify:CR=1 FL=1